MAYVKNTWVDQDVERPKTYEVTNNQDGSITLTDSFGLVTELGTPVNAVNMNHIEDGLVDTDVTKYNATTTYNAGEWVTGVVDNEKGIYASKVNNNTGNALTNDTYWEKVELGGGGSGHDLFDIVPKDHILSYEETKGFAQLGSYVYKEAVAGSRYGYPDFYAKVIAEYNNSADVSKYVSSNVNIVGTLTNNDGVLSGFSASNYVKTPNEFNTSQPWEIVVKFKGYSTTGENPIIAKSQAQAWMPRLLITATGQLRLSLTNNTSSWSVCNVTGTTILNANDWYWVKAEFTGSAYNLYYSTDGVNYVLEGTTASSTVYTLGLQNIGYCYDAGTSTATMFGGSIDLNESYINIDGQRWWTGTNTIEYKENANGHKFYDIADKADIDSLFTARGEAWFYGIDTTNERIFLPRSTRIKFGDTSAVGEYQEAGLPNITGGIPIDDFATTHEAVNPWGAFERGSNLGVHYVRNATASGTYFDYNIDASRSSSVYGRSNTVEYSSTKLIPYMVVGNVSDWSGMTDVVNQGMTILEQVNQGIQSRVLLDGSNAEFPYITETYVNGTSWYRVYSDGWCEQGGLTASYDTLPTTITLLKNYSNTNYSVQCTQVGSNIRAYSMGVTDKTTSGFKVYSGYCTNEGVSHTAGNSRTCWYACGY